MDDPGKSPEVEIYMERARIICSGIVGEEFLPLVEQAEKLIFGPEHTDLEGARRLYQRAFDLFHTGYRRFLESPEVYEGLETWKEETTVPWIEDGTAPEGKGHPGVHEALFEGYEDCLSDYLFCLGQLADVYRTQGHTSMAADCQSDADELRLFARRMQHDQA